MSEARALNATERCRQLVAEPERMGLKRRDGLEPLDVSVMFNRKHAKTTAAYQVVVTMKLSLDGSGVPPFATATALVAQGHTEAQALEMFFNWMADDNAVGVFVESVKAHRVRELDVLAQAELSKKAEAEAVVARGAEALQQNWAERTLDRIARQMGVKDKKVQV